MRRSIFVVFVLTACTFSTHATQPATLGTPARSADLVALLDSPGPLSVDTVVAADWQVPLSGLLNLDHPRAQAAGLKDRDEAMQVYMHAVRHPVHGTFLVDTGMERVHIDHVSGMPDVPKGTPVYVGPGETTPTSFQNLFVRGTVDRQLAGHEPISEWAFAPDADGAFAGVLDVFGDGSLWALHVPGHTPGSTAYVARTASGPILLVGDACHTRWGWENEVEPGTFSVDQPRSADSLQRLRRFVAAHANIEVRLGHQP